MHENFQGPSGWWPEPMEPSEQCTLARKLGVVRSHRAAAHGITLKKRSLGAWIRWRAGAEVHGGGTPVAAAAAAAKCQAASFASYALVSLVYCAWFLEWFIIF